MLSFGSARAVELRQTSLVFLSDRCHRVLGARRLWPDGAVFPVGFAHLWYISLPRYRNAVGSLCVIIAVKTLRSF